MSAHEHHPHLQSHLPNPHAAAVYPNTYAHAGAIWWRSMASLQTCKGRHGHTCMHMEAGGRRHHRPGRTHTRGMRRHNDLQKWAIWGKPRTPTSTNHTTTQTGTGGEHRRGTHDAQRGTGRREQGQKRVSERPNFAPMDLSEEIELGDDLGLVGKLRSTRKRWNSQNSHFAFFCADPVC